MSNQVQPKNFWRLYSIQERGWLALCFLAGFMFVQAFFSHPAFLYRDQSREEKFFLNCYGITLPEKMETQALPKEPAGDKQAKTTCKAVDLQLSFTAARFKQVLKTWRDIATFKRSVWQIDFLFPLVYAGLLAFAYAWCRRKHPNRLDQIFFLAPVVAAVLDCIENGLHLYLLRAVDTPAQVDGADFSSALVLIASICALVKLVLLLLTVMATLAGLVILLVRKRRRVIELLPYVYLLRFPILTAFSLVGIVYLSFFTGARSLLENLFDLRTWGIFFVSLAAFLAAWTTMAAFRMLLLYGADRFDVASWGVSERFGWGYFARHGLLAMPLVIGAVLKSGGNSVQVWLGYPGAILMAALGLTVSVVLLWLASYLHRLFTVPEKKSATGAQEMQKNDPEARYVDLLLPSPRPWQSWLDQAYRANPAPKLSKKLKDRIDRLSAKLGPGYLDAKWGGMLEAHLLVTALTMTSLAVYIGIGAGKYWWLGDDSGIPALSYAIWLLLLLGWSLSGLAFLLDRYRLPVLIPVLILLTITAQCSQSDHYFELSSVQETNRPLTPQEVTQTTPGNQDEDMIVVAVSGGGIQAAAWAAKVLTELEVENPDAFGRRIRLISSVSGGSVGAMYFVNAYQNGSLNQAQLPSIVEQAKYSSINAVAWGLVYPDFVRTFCPICPSLFKFEDRGQALEEAWLKADKSPDKSLSKATLVKWREDAKERRRPAVIFNTTITDTGERLLLATSTPCQNSEDPGCKEDEGSRNFWNLYPEYDLNIVTAARLSASFPYASPAARAAHDKLEGPQFHVVDGGYYDNYGISSLAQWLDKAITGCGPTKRVLILQIRAFPIENGDEGPAKQAAIQRGWFYQAFAPVSTLLNVRTAGQFSHNQVELNLLRKVLETRNVNVELADFEFKGPDKDASLPPPCTNFDRGAEQPLSWHLTRCQMEKVNWEWANKDSVRQEAGKVKTFLNASNP